MATFPEGLKILFHNSSVSRLKKLSSSSEIIKFRILDMMASISSVSVEAFQMCESKYCCAFVRHSFATSAFLKEILESIQTDDILSKLNTMELLDKVGHFQNLVHFIGRYLRAMKEPRTWNTLPL